MTPSSCGGRGSPDDPHLSLDALFPVREPALSLKARAAETGETSRAKLWPYISSVIPATIDYHHFGLRPMLLGVLFGAFHIDTPEKVATLAKTYDLSKKYFAPFMVKTAVDMLPDFFAATKRNPRARIVFVGRDGFSLGYIVKTLCSGFHTECCRDLYLSRSIVDAALSELEAAGGAYPAVEVFRKRASGGANPGPAWRALTRYFEKNDLQLDEDGAEVLLVDTGYKGSVQEMLAAAYPRTRFRGHYVFFGASPHDPHPGTKKGHALHLDVARSSGGKALRGPLPEDLELTFSHHEAIVALEEMLQGSQLSPPALSPTGKPLTLRYRRSPKPLEGLNPVLIAPEYADLYLREGVLSMNVLAVSHRALELAPQIETTSDD